MGGFNPVRSAVGVQSDLEVILLQIDCETWFPWLSCTVLWPYILV